jgi:hypothetical protein
MVRKAFPKNDRPIKPKIDGTHEEAKDAFLKAQDMEIRIMDFMDNKFIDEIPDEMLAFYKRYHYYAKYGSKKGYSVAAGDTKLTHADVMYILSTNISYKRLSKKFNISEVMIRKIRTGGMKCWQEEYLTWQRALKRATCKYKKNYSYNHITLLTDASTNKTIACFSSKSKAALWRREYLVHRLAYGTKNYDKDLKSGKIDLLYPIEEQVVFT